MKKVLISSLVCLACLSAIAQNPSDLVIKFMGVPVDGKKSDVITALKAKGFKYDATYDMLTGEFNGEQSNIRIVENKGKVWRIYVSDSDTRDEAQIRLRFNKLLRQFENSNGKYFALTENESIPESEDISFEMAVHNKSYEASFYYNPVAGNETLRDSILAKCTREFMDYLITVQKDTVQGTQVTYEEYYSDENNFNSYIQMSASLETMAKYIDVNYGVWFKINEFRGKYYIAIFYDNENNRANGEDL